MKENVVNVPEEQQLCARQDWLFPQFRRAHETLPHKRIQIRVVEPKIWMIYIYWITTLKLEFVRSIVCDAFLASTIKNDNFIKAKLK